MAKLSDQMHSLILRNLKLMLRNLHLTLEVCKAANDLGDMYCQQRLDTLRLDIERAIMSADNFLRSVGVPEDDNDRH